MNSGLHTTRTSPLQRMRGARVSTTLLTITALFLLAAMCIAPVAAEEHTGHPEITGTWDAWTATETLPTTAGSYSLTADIELGDIWTVPTDGAITLCLNGNVINLNGNSIEVPEGATLNITDCQTTEHKFTITDGLWTLDESGSESLSGGVITGGDSGVYVNGGTFNLNGGNIVGNTAYYGGSIYVEGGEFTMYGGIITGNTAEYNGGGVYVGEDGSFTMYDGDITRNTANKGGVYVDGGEFTLHGGDITENTAYYGGGVYVEDGSTFTVSGNPKITENTILEETTPNNVYLSDGAIISILGDLEEAEIGFTIAYPAIGAVIAEGAAEGDETKFTSDIDEFTTEMKEGNIILKSSKPAPAAGNHDCNEIHGTWYEWNITTHEPIASGNYYLGSNVELSRIWSVPSGADIVLCLNGYSLRLKDDIGDRVVDVPAGATLTLYDCTGIGTITGGEYSGVYVEGGTFTMYGGIITENTASYGGGVYVGEDGYFTMYGGTITGNTAYLGGGVYVGADGSFAMYGGTITGNIAEGDGGGVYVEGGEVTMSGGNIAGNTASYGGGGVYVSNYSDWWDNTIISSGTFTMKNGATISDNTAEGNGGGVEVYDGAFIMDGGTISQNTVSGNGGGLDVYGGAFTMGGGAISQNTAEYGDGVYVSNHYDYEQTIISSGTITVSGDAEIAEDNEVYLRGVDESLPFICVSGDSFTGSVENITLPDTFLVEGTKVVSFTDSSLTEEQITAAAENFALKNSEAGFVLALSGKNLYLTSPKELPIPEPTIDGDGNTTIIDGEFTPETNTLEIEAAGISVTVLFESATEITPGTINGKVETVTISYDPAPSTVETTGTAAVYQLTIIMDNVSKAYPAINGNFDTAVAAAVTSNNTKHQPLAMITALMGSGDLTTFSKNITTNGIVLTFIIPKSLIEDPAKIRAYHVDGSDATPVDHDVVADGNSWKITVYGNTFSSYVIAEDTTPKDTTPSSSTPQGSSVWLTETPTPTPTATPTEPELVPTSMPTAQPTKTPASPLSVLSVMAGLGAVAVLRRR